MWRKLSATYEYALSRCLGMAVILLFPCTIQAQYLSYDPIYDSITTYIVTQNKPAVARHFQLAKDKGFEFTFGDKVLILCYLNRFEELQSWLENMERPDYGYLIGDPRLRYYVYADSYQQLIIDALKSMEIEIESGELKDFLRIYLQLEKNTNFESRIEYNRSVRAFLERYPMSKFRLLVRYHLQFELELNNAQWGLESGVSSGFDSKELPGSGSSPNSGAIFISGRMYGGYKRHYFSLTGLFNFGLDSVLTYVGQDGPFKRYNYSKFCLRYDFQCVKSDRWDAFVFVDYGLGRAKLLEAGGGDSLYRAIRFGTLTTGLRLNWNYSISKILVGLDQKVTSNKFYLGLELSGTHNFYNFTSYYRDYFSVGLHVGLCNHLFRRKN